MATGMAGFTGATSNGNDIHQRSGTIGEVPLSGLREIPVEWINVGPWQPRRRFDRLALEESQLRSGKWHRSTYIAASTS